MQSPPWGPSNCLNQVLFFFRMETQEKVWTMLNNLMNKKAKWKNVNKLFQVDLQFTILGQILLNWSFSCSSLFAFLVENESWCVYEYALEYRFHLMLHYWSLFFNFKIGRYYFELKCVLLRSYAYKNEHFLFFERKHFKTRSRSFLNGTTIRALCYCCGKLSFYFEVALEEGCCFGQCGSVGEGFYFGIF